MTVRVDVRSEIDPLELVVTSRPGGEFQAMLPENLERYRPGPDGRPRRNPDYLLFDDLVLLSALQREHDQLTQILSAVTGSDGQVDFRWLLASTLSSDEARDEVIEETIALERELYGVDEEGCRRAQAGLEQLDATRLAEAIISGRVPQGGEGLLKWPAPNTLFARDLIVAVGDALVLTHAAEPARRRDMTLMRAIARHHPLLRDVARIDLRDDGPVRDEAGPVATLEGGDVQVLSDEVVLIGVGLRTTMAAVQRLAPRLFARGVSVVLACEMPRRRAAMHIDTLLTRIDEGRCLIFPPLVTDPQGQGIRLHRLTPEGCTDAGQDLLAALAEVDVRLEPIFCGGDDPVAQAREQWSDGANAFALAPGVIVCYARNERTLRELNRAGYEILSPAQFAPNAMSYVHDPDRKVAVTLQGHELVRGRGGPRCLTMPLRRRAD
ncbi:MAG: arginine deiminase family protein [Myxococcota bacterium]|jgi:arginine deiminase|nr:arginine deiminase family protein [Myxococcota bacterium]